MKSRIDQIHTRAICAEIADRLRISLSQDPSPLPTFLKLRLDQLRKAPLRLYLRCGLLTSSFGESEGAIPGIFVKKVGRSYEAMR
jgi:hypothetical protein